MKEKLLLFTILFFSANILANEGILTINEIPDSLKESAYSIVQLDNTFVDVKSQDEMKIYIPTIEELKNQSEVGEGKININTASKEILMGLPGVGESKAEQIISYREKQGLFKCIEDIMSISGIKEGLFEKIKEYITV